MNLAILFAIFTVMATTAGGVLAFKSRDRFHLVLGLSAGLLLGLVGFDLLPEVFARNADKIAGVPVVSIAILGGFLLLHVLERAFGSHEPAESDKTVTIMNTTQFLELLAHLQWAAMYF